MRPYAVRLMLVALAAGGAVAAVPASAADGGMCQLCGNATITKGPSTTDHPTAVSRRPVDAPKPLLAPVMTAVLV